MLLWLRHGCLLVAADPFPQVGYLMVAEVSTGAPGLYDEIRLIDAEYAPPAPNPDLAQAQAWRRLSTILASAQQMPTAKIAVPKTKTCGGMPILVTP